jgi:hypothetical protein
MEINREKKNSESLHFPMCSNTYHDLSYHTNYTIDGTLFTCVVNFFQTKNLESSVSATLYRFLRKFCSDIRSRVRHVV